MRKLVTSAIVLGSLLVGGSALAQESGLQLGARLGYGLPMGKVMKASDGAPSDSTNLSKGVSGQIPIWIDVGYRIDPSIMVGAYFQYGFGMLGDDMKKFCDDGGLDCSVSDMRFGLQGHYHLSPGESMDPWFGLGIGYEILSDSMSGTIMGQKIDGSSSLSGLEFANLQAGADFEVSPGFGVGPFVSFSLGQYSKQSSDDGQTDNDIEDKAMHEWLVIGVRGAFNL